VAQLDDEPTTDHETAKTGVASFMPFSADRKRKGHAWVIHKY
jgi:hypothetical protein